MIHSMSHYIFHNFPSYFLLLLKSNQYFLVLLNNYCHLFQLYCAIMVLQDKLHTMLKQSLTKLTKLVLDWSDICLLWLYKLNTV